jgi:hypothetical protein
LNIKASIANPSRWDCTYDTTSGTINFNYNPDVAGTEKSSLYANFRVNNNITNKTETYQIGFPNSISNYTLTIRGSYNDDNADNNYNIDFPTKDGGTDIFIWGK